MDPTFFLIYYFDFFILEDLFSYEIWNQTYFILPRLNLGLIIASPWHPDTPCRLLSLFIIRALETAKIKIRIKISLCILLNFEDLLQVFFVQILGGKLWKAITDRINLMKMLHIGKYASNVIERKTQVSMLVHGRLYRDVRHWTGKTQVSLS